LFGRDRGACVGTPENTGGLLAAAEGGTLFLDEIGNLNGAMQMSMLRVLERREYHQVGGTRALHANARVISASHRDLQELVLAGRFRDDLLYRISTVDLRVPPLRERPEDIPHLAQHFLRSFRPMDRPARLFSPTALDALKRYPWPGNVRELRNVVERLSVQSPPECTDPIGQVISMVDHNRRRPSIQMRSCNSLFL
jgi:DNA-binding NtrC family response regulator